MQLLAKLGIRICIGAFILLNLSCQQKNDERTVILDIEQQLMDGVASGDRNLWDKYLLDSCLITIEDGTRLSKKEYLEGMQPLPATHVGRIKILSPRVVSLGRNVYVISYIVDEYLDLYNQHIHTQYMASNTWVKRDGWKLASMQVFEIPKNPNPISHTPDVKDIIGVYRLSDEVTYTIALDDSGTLTGRRSGRAPQELFRESGDVYFDNNPRVRKIFVRTSGAVTHMIDRRAGEDLLWTKMK